MATQKQQPVAPEVEPTQQRYTRGITDHDKARIKHQVATSYCTPAQLACEWDIAVSQAKTFLRNTIQPQHLAATSSTALAGRIESATS